MEQYFLKLAGNEGFFEEVDKYTFDNHKFALADDGESPRYEVNTWAILKDGQVSMQLSGPVRDIAILQRAFQASAPERVNGGFIREPQVIKFRKGRSMTMRHLKDGQNWRMAA